MPETSINIRCATETDAQRIHELHLSSVRNLCAANYEPTTIEGWLVNRSAQGYLRGIRSGSIFVAETNSRIVGFCEAVPGEVVAVFVDPAVAHQGIGSVLLEKALSLAKQQPGKAVRLEATLNAVGFYEKFGFTSVKSSVVRRNQVEVPIVIMEHHDG